MPGACTLGTFAHDCSAAAGQADRRTPRCDAPRSPLRDSHLSDNLFASSTPNPGPAQAFCIFCQVQGRNAPRLLPSHPIAAEAARGEPCSRLLSARHRGHRILGRAVVFTPFLKDGQQNHQSMVPIPFCLGTCPLKAAEAAQGRSNRRVCPLATPPRPPALCWWGPTQPPWSCIHRHPRQRRAGGAGTRKVPR